MPWWPLVTLVVVAMYVFVIVVGRWGERNPKRQVERVLIQLHRGGDVVKVAADHPRLTAEMIKEAAASVGFRLSHELPGEGDGPATLVFRRRQS